MTTHAYLRAVGTHLPSRVVTNEDLVRNNPTWNAEAIFQKVGIRNRHVVAADETAADLGFQAAETLFEQFAIDRSSVDALLFCTQSPDHFLPASACLLQQRLRLPTECAAFDYNQGCSGFTYGLWLARALILSGSAKNVLLIAADTYTKYCDPHDLATVSVFGDAGAAALVTAEASQAWAEIGESVVGTDGRGGPNLIVRNGAARHPSRSLGEQAAAENNPDDFLFMNGPEILSFTMSGIQPSLERLAQRAGLHWEQVDWFLFHQANSFMLQHLRKRMQIPVSKLPIRMEQIGNTVSATLPLLIEDCRRDGLFRADQHCLLAGFGVGYSWAMTHLRWLEPSSTS